MVLTGLNGDSIAEPLDTESGVSHWDETRLKVGGLVLRHTQVLHGLREDGGLHHGVIRSGRGCATLGALQVVDLGHGRLVLGLQVDGLLGCKHGSNVLLL